jgi:cytochrome c oxidase subunit III
MTSRTLLRPKSRLTARTATKAMNATARAARAASTELAAQQRARSGRIGVWVFIVSETMFFAALFFAWYYMRIAAGQVWPPLGAEKPPMLPAVINTAITVLSGAAMWYANRSIARDNRRGLIIGAAASAVLGVLFMAVQTIEFSDLAQLAQQDAYGSMFIIVLFFHVARVLIGVGMIGLVLVRALMGQFSAKRRLAVEGATWYWYFIVAVWLVVFVVLYLN